MLDDMDREDVVAVIDRMVEELLKQPAWRSRPWTPSPWPSGTSAWSSVSTAASPSAAAPSAPAAGRRSSSARADRGTPPVDGRPRDRRAPQDGPPATRLGIEPERPGPMPGESLANLFAHRLLVPTCLVRRRRPRLDFDLPALKERYSHRQPRSARLAAARPARALHHHHHRQRPRSTAAAATPGPPAQAGTRRAKVPAPRPQHRPPRATSRKTAGPCRAGRSIRPTGNGERPRSVVEEI